MVAKINKVERKYRGFTVTAEREMSLGGDELLYFYIFRDSDGWCFEDSFENSNEEPLTMVNYLCGHIDDFFENPQDYDAPDREESDGGE